MFSGRACMWSQACILNQVPGCVGGFSVTLFVMLNGFPKNRLVHKVHTYKGSMLDGRPISTAFSHILHLHAGENWRHCCYQVVRQSHSCERNISRTFWGNFFKFGTNVHLELNTTWLDFGGHGSKVRVNVAWWVPFLWTQYLKKTLREFLLVYILISVRSLHRHACLADTMLVLGDIQPQSSNSSFAC